MPRFEGELVETPEPKPRFAGEAVMQPEATTVEPPKRDKTGMQRMTQALESGVGGGIMGAATPELTQLAGKGLQLYAPTRIPGMMIEQAGRGMRGARGTAIGTGVLGGLTGDIAGQAVEVRGGSPMAVFLAEVAGGVVGPEFAKTVTKAIQYGSRKLLGIEPMGAVRAVAQDLGLDEKTLTPTQRDYIKKQIEQLRGGYPSTSAQESIYDVLRTGATDIEKLAKQQARAEMTVGGIQQRAAEAQAQRMRFAGKRTQELASETERQAKAARSQIGQEREASEIGTSLRDKIMQVFSGQTEKRSAEYRAQKQIRDAAVAEKEGAGQLVKDMPEYQTLLQDLRNKLLIGAKAQEQKTAPVTERGVLQAYQNIYDAVAERKVQTGVNELGNPVYKRFPTSFDALDDVRRRLGDVAFGKEVEGYSAIGADIAKKFYAQISDIQSKFAGEAHDILQGNYEAASRLLDKYRSAAGKKATALDRFDPTRFKTDAASLPADYFTSKQSVKDLVELTGGDKTLVQKAASDYVARQLRDMDANRVRAWVNKNDDWLTSSDLPGLKSKVESYLKTLERAERVTGKSQKAAATLAAREPKVLRAGEQAVTAAEKRAGEITSEAEKRIQTILGDRNPAARVREIILGGKPSVWAEVGPILSSSEQGKQAVAEAVRQIMADRAETGLVSAIRVFREDVAPSLRQGGLMSDSQLRTLETQLMGIARSAQAEEAKLNLMQRAIKNAIIGVTAQPVGAAAIEGAKAVSPMSFSDVINQRGSVTSVAPRFK